MKGERKYTFPERDEYDEAQRLLAVKDHGEVAIVEYFKSDGVWRPGNIVTRERIKSGPYEGQWVAKHYDADWSRTHGNLYVHCSGSGGRPVVHISRFCRPKPAPCRIWIAPGVRFKKRGMTSEALLACGYIRIEGPTPAPFADSIDGDTFWCSTCKDHLPDDDGHYCGICREQHHVHKGTTVLVAAGEVEQDEDGEDERGEHGLVPGAYLIQKFPYYADGMITGHKIYEDALKRVGDVPEDVDFDGYECTHLCDACSSKTVKATKLLPVATETA